MNMRILLPVVGFVSFWSACIPSVNPLFTAKDLVSDQRLVGGWVEKDKQQPNDEGWTFELKDDSTYKLTVVEEKGKRGEFEARLVKLKNHLFLDVTPSQVDWAQGQAELTEWAFIPGHLILRVHELGSELKMSFMDPDWLKKYAAEHPKALAHSRSRTAMDFITASTSDLQKFVMAHLAKGELFGDPGVFIRRTMAPPGPATPVK